MQNISLNYEKATAGNLKGLKLRKLGGNNKVVALYLCIALRCNPLLKYQKEKTEEEELPKCNFLHGAANFSKQI